MEKHFMVDIEATGTDFEKDKILQVALVEIALDGNGYWDSTGKEFVSTLHYPGGPESDFAKKHMKALYKKCNEIDARENYQSLKHDLEVFLHEFSEVKEPKFFMGWNASTFDIPFLLKAGVLAPSYYTRVDGKEVLRGDVHYRVYEQTGSLKLLEDATGFSRGTIKSLGEDLNPKKLPLPEGKLHDALYDCYNQINMQNGFIALTRKGWNKYGR